jgi:hypothetical protein
MGTHLAKHICAKSKKNMGWAGKKASLGEYGRLTDIHIDLVLGSLGLHLDGIIMIMTDDTYGCFGLHAEAVFCT